MAGRKRGNREGSVYQRKSDGRWVAAKTLEYGRRKVFYGRTQAEVLQKLKDFEKIEHRFRFGPRQTLQDYLTRWLEGVERRRERAPMTIYNYGRTISDLIPLIGSIPIGELRREHVQHAFDSLAGRYSPNTVHTRHAALTRALHDAVDSDIIPFNPAIRIKLPRVDSPEQKTLTEEQVKQLLESTKGSRYHALWHVLLSTGIRSGESRALRWSDIDYEDRSLTIGRTLRHYAYDRFEFAETKTKAGRRRVPLPRQTLDALRAHRLIQKEERLRAMAWQDYDLVFTTEIGMPLSQGAVKYCLERDLTAAGCPIIRIHDLRHTFATLMLGRRIPTVYVQHTLGHSSSGITSDLYSHFLPTMSAVVSDTMESILRGAATDSAVSSENDGQEASERLANGQ